jgi:C1A family cysteine protease
MLTESTDHIITKNEKVDKFDWREKKGVVGDVTDQGGCGSCWAFSTIGNVESVNFIKRGDYVRLSEQQLVDCGISTHGCQGGWMGDALKDMIKLGGFMTGKDYPYKSMDQECQFDASEVAVKIDDFVVKKDFKDDETLEDLIINYGPIAITVDASYLFDYESGILDNPKCSTEINHAVLAVGWGIENDIPFWIIRNSWGPKWGDKGYFKLRKGGNRCGYRTYVASAIIN